MGRIIAFLLGGAALALYAPPLFLKEAQAKDYYGWWEGIAQKVGMDTTHPAILATCGAGILAGVALVLFAVRGGESHGGPA